MDKKTRKSDKKMDVKDRGDLKKGKPLSPREISSINLERGDSVRKPLEKVKNKIIVKKTDEDTKKEPKKDWNIRKSEKENNQLELRKFLRDKYTVKLNLNKNDGKDKALANGKTEKSDEDSSNEEKKERRPIIKTITIKNGGRVYKAVSFVEKKKTPVTPLEIKVPLDVAESRTANKVSKSSLSVKSRIKRCTPSPRFRKQIKSPKTEVAKWVPSCVTKHTQPYYEAWIDTTPAAVSKISSKEKHDIFEMLETKQDGCQSPELVHEKYRDESYVGRIRIKQK